MTAAVNAVVVPEGLPPADEQALRDAWCRLERPSFAARASSVLGTPLEAGLRRLPRSFRRRLDSVTERALEHAFDVALGTLEPLPASAGGHRALTVGLGAAGGFFGAAGLLVELPITTVVMLRTIADAARSEGEDPAEPETRLACLQVFALGSPSPEDDAAETGFLELRAALAAQFANPYVPALLGGGGPAGASMIQLIAKRFGVVVGQKAAARAVPIVGAASGATLNALFFQHFLEIARGQFTVRRLERAHGRLLISETYERIGQEMRADAGSRA